MVRCDWGLVPAFTKSVEETDVLQLITKYEAMPVEAREEQGILPGGIREASWRRWHGKLKGNPLGGQGFRGAFETEDTARTKAWGGGSVWIYLRKSKPGSGNGWKDVAENSTEAAWQGGAGVCVSECGAGEEWDGEPPVSLVIWKIASGALGMD